MSQCSQNCIRSVQSLYTLIWQQMSLTATYTAETVLLVVNNQTNSTRTSTIKNTEINFADIITPTNTNSAGTVTTTIINGPGDTRTVYGILRNIVNLD